jgi:hypothetical protein
VSAVAAHAQRVVFTVALFLLLMPGLVTAVFALPMSLEGSSFYYQWGSFVHMMRLGYIVGLPAAAITGIAVALLPSVLRQRVSLYAAAALIGALSVVAFAVIRNGMQNDYAGLAVAGALGAVAALVCTALARLARFRPRQKAPAT